MRPAEWTRDGFTVSTDPARVDLGVVHGFLTTCYWSEGISRATVERQVAHSLPFGLYRDAIQIGFARVVSDFTAIAYVGDVFVLQPWRGRGLSRFLMECMVAHPELQGLRRWILLTRDAHGLYEKFGFERITNPDRWMHRWDPDAAAKRRD
ncbi:MAG: GNAT family N-acetyltransferase [Candidatus Eisenbacteria bacterium]|uniref:GNAT family N-acetyltransferase n=1 Tax=Eiseniibacteriota bacterium TaxID=2212470 RepID=A0A933W1T7_UNCEI|nr:GNAT family N-acetyltransferase [Candidatus Eisenbacteria bacterium]